jgi:undecaprenyl diphosphate synthase
MTLVVAFNYGSRDEIVRKRARLAADVACRPHRGRRDRRDAAFGPARHGRLPDPELVIRTSGETRISNFLLWQAAYAEFVFTPVLWPDFDRAALEDALAEYRVASAASVACPSRPTAMWAQRE